VAPKAPGDSPAFQSDGTNHMKNPMHTAVVHTFNAFRWSLAGLAAALRTEISFRVDAVLFIVFFALGLWLGETLIEKLLLVGVLFIVLIADLLNAAIETVVDMVSPDYSENAKRAKDIASAAVFLALLLVLVTWGLILFA